MSVGLAFISLSHNLKSLRNTTRLLNSPIKDGKKDIGILMWHYKKKKWIFEEM